MNEIIIYTDGSCLGNPGKGGWAAVIINDSIEEVIFGSEKESTNNRMELTAAINALLKIKQDKKIKIYTDSKYVKDGIEKWISNWKLNNWKNANKKDVKNKDLWKKLDSIISKNLKKKEFYKVLPNNLNKIKNYIKANRLH